MKLKWQEAIETGWTVLHKMSGHHQYYEGWKEALETLEADQSDKTIHDIKDKFLHPEPTEYHHGGMDCLGLILEDVGYGKRGGIEKH
jgi:hypothetical protein